MTNLLRQLDAVSFGKFIAIYCLVSVVVIVCQFGWLEHSTNPLESSSNFNYKTDVSRTTEEIVQVCEALPPDKQAELADFARFLLARLDDDAWERRLAFPEARPRLDSFLHDSAAEGDEPLDPSRL